MRNHDQGNSVTHLIVFYFNCYWMNRVLLIWLAPGTLNWKYYNEDLTRIVVWYVILFLYHAFYHIREIKHAKYGMVWHILWHGGQKAEQQNGHTKWSKLPFLGLDFSRNNFLAPHIFFVSHRKHVVGFTSVFHTGHFQLILCSDVPWGVFPKHLKMK